ncbi:hypothetical protein SDC9_20630 [bioreactor metagenome]|uniref:Uncharacterized protein n=1 Tax=bioreactor metagenome TaxID=1076179 RepID=A0A644U7A3_9ZZZZ
MVISYHKAESRAHAENASGTRLSAIQRTTRPQHVHPAHKLVDLLQIVHRRGGEAQPLGAARHGREIDRLHVDAEFLEQHVRQRLGVLGIADHHRHDMAAMVDDRHAERFQPHLQDLGMQLLLVAQRLPGRGLEEGDRGGGARGDHRRQRGGEDEARRIGAQRVHHLRRARDIAAEDAKGLTERAVEDVDAAHLAQLLGDAGAARAIHADRVHLVEIGQRVELGGKVADLGDLAEIAVHRIDRFKGDELRRRRIVGRQQLAQMRDVVVAEDPLRPGVALDPLDHRGVVERVRIDDEARKQHPQGRERRVIGDIGRGEDQRRFLLMQVGKLGLELLVIDRRARDVARAARARAGGIERLVHGRKHHRVLAHAEIIVAAPDGDLFLRAVRARPHRLREGALFTLDVDEDPVAALVVQLLDRLIEREIVVHFRFPCLVRWVCLSGLYRVAALIEVKRPGWE